MFASENDPLLGDGEQIIHLNEDLNNYYEIILPCKLVGSLKYQVQQGFSSDSNLWSNVILALMATVLFLKSILNEIPFAVGSTIMHQLEMDHSTWQYSQALIFVLLCIPGGMLIWNDRCRKFNVMIFVLSGVFMVSGCMLFVAGIQQKRIGFVFVGEFLSGFDDIWLLNGILALLNFTQSHVLPKTIFLTVSSRSGQIVSSISLPILHSLFLNEAYQLYWCLVIALAICMIAVLLITILKGNNIIQPSVLKGHISHPHMILNGALLYGTLNAFHVISADFLAIEINNDLMARGIYRSVPLLVEIIMLASNSSSILKGRNWFPIIGLIGPILAASSYIGLGYFKLNPIAILIIFGLVSYSASDVMIGVETSRQENNYRPSFVRYIVISIIPMLSAKIYGYYGNYESVLWFYTTAVMVQFLLNLRSLLRRKDVQDQPASNEETANESLPKHHASHLRYASNASEGRSITETLASRTWHSRALGNDYRVIGPSRYMPQSRNIVVPELSSIDSDGSIAGSVE